MDDARKAAAQFTATLEIVAFEPADVAAATANLLTTVMDLRTHKKGTLLAAPSVTTWSGQEATVKGCVKYIYPTDFSVLIGSSNTNATATAELPAVEPSAFETREVGTVFSFCPKLIFDQSAAAIVLAEFIEQPEWRDYGMTYTNSAGEMRRLPMEQPFFPKYCVETTVTVEDGQTVLVGGGVPMRDGKRLIYAFLTVHFVDPAGKPLPDRPQTPPVADDKAKE